MRVLLDTHTLLWALAAPSRLSTTAATLLRDPRTVVLVSAASAWEIATKHRIGKLPGAGPVLASYSAHLATLRAEELPIRAADAIRAGLFPSEHRDPFDRVLAAQAMLESVPLVTNDPIFASFEGLATHW